MSDTLTRTLQTLRATPEVIRALLYPLDPEDYRATPGRMKGSISDLLLRLTEMEKQDFREPIRRMIEEEQPELTISSIPTKGAEELAAGVSRMAALVEFEKNRVESIDYLEKLTVEDLLREGLHPEAGKVRIKELLSAWAFADLTHIQHLAELVKQIGFWEGMGRMQESGDRR